MQTVTYLRLYNILREKILKKAFLPGAKIPTERELCMEYGVSRITVRHALMLLQEQGFVERIQGRGTFVRVQKQKKIAIMDYAYSISVKRENPGVVRKLITNEIIIPSPEITSDLNLMKNEGCLFIERVDYLDGEKLAYDQVFIPLEFSKNLTTEVLARIDFLEIWQQKESITGSFFRESIEAAAAGDIDVKRLGIPLGTPVLVCRERLFDKDERALAVFISTYRYDKFKLVSSYPVETVLPRDEDEI